MKTLQEHMDEVMDCFDFNKVHKVMNQLNWRWCDSKEPPSIQELRVYVRERMRQIYQSSCRKTKSAGFSITYESWNADGVEFDGFCVEFIVSDWDTNEE